MLLTIDSEKFISHNIIINYKIKNNILNNSDFYRIFYSDEYMTTNGIFINFSLSNIYIEKYFNKIKCSFSKDNDKVVNSLLKIEKTILNKLNVDYNPDYRIEDQLNQYFIKIFHDNYIQLGEYDKLNFIMKISGIWSSDNNKNYGLTFRFYISNNN
jgi:hypothetical protein